jgi:hypothetical protein
MQICSQKKRGPTEDHTSSVLYNSSSVLYNSSILTNAEKFYPKKRAVVNSWKKSINLPKKINEIDKKKKIIRQQLDREAKSKEDALKSMLVTHANSITVLDKNFAQKTVFVEYKICGQNLQKNFDKNLLERKFMRKYLHMMNPERNKPGAVIATAKRNFQVFLEKLQGQFFVITLPEGVLALNQDFDDFYSRSPGIETSAGIVSVSVIEESQLKVVETAIYSFISEIQVEQAQQAKILKKQTKNDEKWFFDRFLGMSPRELRGLVIF